MLDGEVKRSSSDVVLLLRIVSSIQEEFYDVRNFSEHELNGQNLRELQPLSLHRGVSGK
jgi:hypothetical protein